MSEVSEKTMQLLVKRNNNYQMIERLEDSNRELTNQMCDIEGNCPHCRNWHYPHCGEYFNFDDLVMEQG